MQGYNNQPLSLTTFAECDDVSVSTTIDVDKKMESSAGEDFLLQDSKSSEEYYERRLKSQTIKDPIISPVRGDTPAKIASWTIENIVIDLYFSDGTVYANIIEDSYQQTIAYYYIEGLSKEILARPEYLPFFLVDMWPRLAKMGDGSYKLYLNPRLLGGMHWGWWVLIGVVCVAGGAALMAASSSVAAAAIGTGAVTTTLPIAGTVTLGTAATASSAAAVNVLALTTVSTTAANIGGGLLLFAGGGSLVHSYHVKNPPNVNPVNIELPRIDIEVKKEVLKEKVAVNEKASEQLGKDIALSEAQNEKIGEKDRKIADLEKKIKDLEALKNQHPSSENVQVSLDGLDKPVDSSQSPSQIISDQPGIPGLISVPIRGDGHCFYRSVALHYPPLDREARCETLRNYVATYLQEHLDGENGFRKPIVAMIREEEKLIGREITIENYLDWIRGTIWQESVKWADNIEIAALRLALDRQIVIVNPDKSLRKEAEPIDINGPKATETIFVHYNETNHYNGYRLMEGHSNRDILHRLLNIQPKMSMQEEEGLRHRKKYVEPDDANDFDDTKLLLSKNRYSFTHPRSLPEPPKKEEPKVVPKGRKYSQSPTR